MLPLGVFVQVFVARSQELAPQAESSSLEHCLQTPASQAVLPGICEQSSLTWHAPHVLPEHFDAPASLQVELSTQATQVFVAVLQAGSPPVQSLLLRQATQELFEVSQTVALPAQSVLARHATHISLAGLQIGVAPEHAPPHGSSGASGSASPPRSAPLSAPPSLP